MSDTPAEFKLIRLSDFRRNYFEGTRPSIKSLRNMIHLGELKGKKLAGVYYVVIDDDFLGLNKEHSDDHEVDQYSEDFTELDPIVAEFMRKLD